MSEPFAFGEFEVDPDLIPDPPKVTVGIPQVFQVETAIRAEVVKPETGKTVFIKATLRPVEQPEALLFQSWFVTEKYLGSPAKSWKNFLVTMGLDPKNTKAQDIVHLRFKGVAGKDKKRDDDLPILVKVIGPAD